MHKIYFQVWKNNYKYILILLLTAIVCVSAIFEYQACRRAEIGMFGNVEYQYILSACSADQVKEFKQQSFTEDITSFSAASEVVVKKGNKSVEEVGLLVTDTDKDTIDYTCFSKARCVKRAEKINWDDSIFIDYSLAKKLKAGIGDVITFSIDGKNDIEYKVAGIYEATTYADKYMAIVMNRGEVRNTLQKEGYDSLSGAFYTVKSREQFEEYLKKHPYYPEQYIQDMMEGKNEAEKDKIKEEYLKIDWSNKILTLKANTKDVIISGIFSYKAALGLSAALFTLLFLMMIRCTIILTDSTTSGFGTVRLLGYGKNKIVSVMITGLAVVLILILLISTAVGAAVVSNGLFGGVYVARNIISYTVKIYTIMVMLCAVVFLIRYLKESKRNEF